MVHAPFFCFKIPQFNTLALLKTRWPISLNRCATLLAVQFHCPFFWAWEELPCHFSSDPGPKMSLREFLLSNSGLLRHAKYNSHHSFPLNVVEHWHADEIGSMKSSGLMFFVSTSFWISRRIDNDENSLKIVQSHSIAPPPRLTASWHDEYVLMSSTWPFHLSVAPEISFTLSDTKKKESEWTHNFCLRPLRNPAQMRMAALIDEVVNIHHINTFVLFASIENDALVADIPNFFCINWKILSMYLWFVCSMFFNSGDEAGSDLCNDDSCIPCFSILVLKLQVSLSPWSPNIFSHHFLFGFDSPAPIACLL